MLGISFFSSQSYSQKTEYYQDLQNEIRTAKQLFDNSKYNSAIALFEKIQGKVDFYSEIYSEAEYYKAFAAVKSELATGEKLLGKFIEDYPESPYCNKAKFDLGVTQFDKKRYAIAIRSLADVDKTELTEKEKALFHYQMGYSYMMTENLDQAAAEFFIIKDANSMYSKPASYYWAHINYLEGNYGISLKWFFKTQW